MEAVKRKRQTTFRLSSELRDRLRRKAEEEHQSMNELVERLLLDALYYELNEETIAAIEEARAGQYAGTIDASSFDAFMKSINEIE